MFNITPAQCVSRSKSVRVPAVSVWLWLFIFGVMSVLPVSAAQTDLAVPAGSGQFGSTVTVLPNGNIVVTDPSYDITTPGVIADVGAVHLYDGATLALISTLTGSTASDQVGNGGITALTNGNYVVSSSAWNGNRGAATFGSGTTGISGTVSITNSLVGTTANDRVGGYITALSDGNYVVSSPAWNGNRGAATFGSGTTGISGEVSNTNSLVGTTADERVGDGITALTNGNYVVSSPAWNGNRGAATFGSGTTGISGEVSNINSLVGTTADDLVSSAITVLTNGNYVVSSPNWNGNRGAATFGSGGTTGISGEVSNTNSLVGTTADERVGGYITALTNGNYVVSSPGWNGRRGAATFGSGTTGISGTISITNSLVGTTANDQVGIRGTTALTNGNYVVRSPGWNGRRGAATFGSGTTGISGTISNTNSLVGTTANDFVSGDDFLDRGGITALTNGNYVVRSPNWNGKRGAATFGSGTTGISGEVSNTNSLVGTINDRVGSGNITALTNGNYVVGSPNWNGNRGAATFGSGTTGISGTISITNSLVGATANDFVSNGNITALTNGNYVVSSPNWNGKRGAATFGSGTTGISGEVSNTNSLVGTTADDQVGSGNITALTNGNYVVRSPFWDNPSPAVVNASAFTFGNGASGTSGLLTSTNSVVGTVPNGTETFSFDATRNRVFVGRRASNRVTVIFFNTTAVLNNGDINNPATFDNGLPDALINAVVPNGFTVNLNGVSNVGLVAVECGGALSGASATAYIVGSVRRDFCAAANQTFVYPIGDRNNYSPLTASNVTGTGSLTASVVDAVLPRLNLTQSASRYWSLTGGGITTDLSFTYTAADVNGTEAAYRVHRRTAAANVNTPVPTTINMTTHTATVTGISNFSDWGVGNGVLAPTAASVTISGRVITPQIFGLTNAVVTLTDSRGEARTVRTGKRGNFRFTDVAAGETYILSVSSRRYTFAPQVIAVNEDLTDIVFTPDE